MITYSCKEVNPQHASLTPFDEINYLCTGGWRMLCLVWYWHRYDSRIGSRTGSVCTVCLPPIWHLSTHKFCWWQLLLGVEHRSRVMLPTPPSIVSDCCFIFHLISLDRGFILHPIFISHPNDFWRQLDSNLQPPDPQS